MGSLVTPAPNVNVAELTGTTLPASIVNSSLVKLGTLTVGFGGGGINSNTALGVDALLDNTTGNYNTAIGLNALQTNTAGTYNAALGFNALQANTIGYQNTALGIDALQSNTTGNSNTALGLNALKGNMTGNSNIAFGLNAGAYELGSNAFYVDNQDRVNTAGDKAGAILYGVLNATPSLQTLKVNAALTVAGAAKLNTLGAFHAADKYLIVDAGGNIHVSALGPAS